MKAGGAAVSQDLCVLCGRSARGSAALPLCRRCTESTALTRLVTVAQLAALVPGLTEHKIRNYLKHRRENGLETADVLYVPQGTNSVFIHLDRFERWFSGR